MPKAFPEEFRRDVIAVARKGEAFICHTAEDRTRIELRSVQGRVAVTGVGCYCRRLAEAARKIIEGRRQPNRCID